MTLIILPPPNCLICALTSLTILLMAWHHYDSPSVSYTLSERSLIQSREILKHHPVRMGGLFVNSHVLNYHQSLTQILVAGDGGMVLHTKDSCLIDLHYFKQFSVLACDYGSQVPTPRHYCYYQRFSFIRLPLLLFILLQQMRPLRAN
jgi:hypothetical protein